KSSTCPLAAFHLKIRFPVIVEPASRPAHPPAPLVVTLPLIDPERMLRPAGVAPVTVQPPTVAFTFTVAVPVEDGVSTGFSEAVPMIVLHVMLAPDVSKMVDA